MLSMLMSLRIARVFLVSECVYVRDMCDCCVVCVCERLWERE